MPNRSNVYGHKNAASTSVQPLVNDDSRQEVYALGGKTAAYNKSASAVIKASAGRLCRVHILTAGSTAGTINDCATVGTAAAGNLILALPNTVGEYELNWPCATGITYIAGTGQVVAISYI